MSCPPKTPLRPSRRDVLRATAAGAALTLAAPAILRARGGEIVVGGAASHTAWVEQVVMPFMAERHGISVVYEGTRSLVNLEKMRNNRDNPYLSVVQMDDPVMILAVEEDLLRPMDPSITPAMTELRAGAVHMDGMWANYAQPWAGIAYNSDRLQGVPSWAALWAPEAAGRVIIPSLQNTEGVWTLFMAAHLATGKPLAEAQYDIEAAFGKLAELKPNILNVYSTMTQAFNLLEQGEIDMLAGNWSAFALPRQAAGAPVGLAAPSEGIFAMPSGICLVKGGPAEELANLYVNEMLGAELQGRVAEFSSSLATNVNSPVAPGMPEGVEIFSPDWAFVSANRAAWIERFDRLMAA